MPATISAAADERAAVAEAGDDAVADQAEDRHGDREAGKAGCGGDRRRTLDGGEVERAPVGDGAFGGEGEEGEESEGEGRPVGQDEARAGAGGLPLGQ